MILIDTNVVSEVMKIAPSTTVVQWLNNQKSSSLYVSTVTIGEIEYGLRIFPSGKRRLQLKENFERFISLAFAAHCQWILTEAWYPDLTTYRPQVHAQTPAGTTAWRSTLVNLCICK